MNGGGGVVKEAGAGDVILFICIMNHQFQGSRSPTQGPPMPFYNPQKDSINPNNPSLYQNSNPGQPIFLPNSNSKSYIARSSIIDQPKPSNNTSAYLKNVNEQPPKFIPSALSPNANSYQLPFPAKPQPTEMVKSLIHDGLKSPESTFGYSTQPEKPSFLTNTPTRRAPRMSEPHQFDPPPSLKTFEPKGDSGESPVPKKFKDPKEFENNFFKNKQNVRDCPLRKRRRRRRRTCWGRARSGARPRWAGRRRWA